MAILLLIRRGVICTICPCHKSVHNRCALPMHGDQACSSLRHQSNIAHLYCCHCCRWFSLRLKLQTFRQLAAWDFCCASLDVFAHVALLSPCPHICWGFTLSSQHVRMSSQAIVLLPAHPLLSFVARFPAAFVGIWSRVLPVPLWDCVYASDIELTFMSFCRKVCLISPTFVQFFLAVSMVQAQCHA